MDISINSVSYTHLYGLRSAINNPGIMSILLIAISLTAGTVFLMWIGEQITSKGIGNGISPVSYTQLDVYKRQVFARLTAVL